MKGTVAAFFDDLPFHPPLFVTVKGDAVARLVVRNDNTVVIEWLESIHRGAGRAAMATMIESADRHGVMLALTAKPHKPRGEGKKLTAEKLQAFYASFGFVPTGRGEFAHMTRKPK